jgi:hypothetical protein
MTSSFASAARLPSEYASWQRIVVALATLQRATGSLRQRAAGYEEEHRQADVAKN